MTGLSAISIASKSLNSLGFESVVKQNVALDALTIVTLQKGSVASPEPSCTVLGSKNYCRMKLGERFGCN
jgi:hypothetical protein